MKLYDQVYQDYDGDWHPSEWKDGRFYYISTDDGHTYFEDSEWGGGGHDNCPCFNPLLKHKIETVCGIINT